MSRHHTAPPAGDRQSGQRLDAEMLFPVYRNTRGGGANFAYELVGWAGYVITSYETKGWKGNKLSGHFTTVVWESIGSESVGAPDFVPA